MCTRGRAFAILYRQPSRKNVAGTAEHRPSTLIRLKSRPPVKRVSGEPKRATVSESNPITFFKASSRHIDYRHSHDWAPGSDRMSRATLSTRMNQTARREISVGSNEWTTSDTFDNINLDSPGCDRIVLHRCISSSNHWNGNITSRYEGYHVTNKP